MTDRVPWRCPSCRQVYSVPSTQGLTVCPRCVPTTKRVARRSVLPGVLTFLVVLLLGLPLLTFAFGRSWFFSTAKEANPQARVDSKVAEAAAQPPAPQPAVPAEPKPAARPPQPEPKLPATPVNDQQLVRQWLRENLDDGRWEEVRWWPGVTLSELYRARLEYVEKTLKSYNSKLGSLKDEIAAMEDAGTVIKDYAPSMNCPYTKTNQRRLWSLYDQRHQTLKSIDNQAELLKTLTDRGTRRICGLRFRSRNALGANQLHDGLFDVTDGQCTLIDPHSYTAWVDGTDRGWSHLSNPASQASAAQPTNEMGNVLKAWVDAFEKDRKK